MSRLVSWFTGAVRRPLEMAFGSSVERHLLDVRTKRYRATTASVPAWAGTNGWGAFSLGTVDEMRRDWQVKQSLAFKKAPLFTAEFEFEASRPEVQKYAEEMVRTHWDKGLTIGLECMSFGYNGDETLWKEADGVVKYDGLKALHARDVRPFTSNGKLAFVRLKNMGNDLPDATSEGPQANIDLEAAKPEIPAKGVWFTYQPRYNQWFGMSIHTAQWWPWRLKTMPDGAMENIFKAFYKHAFGGMVFRHPNDTFADSSQAITSAQDYARQLGENVKAGANFALGNSRDAKGEFEWQIEKYGGDIVADFSGLIAYPDWLDKLIVRGAEIPDEIITHDGNSGGFSRSNIAFLAFLILEEEALNHHVREFKDQLLDPAIRFNYGPDAWVKIKAKPLLPDPSKQPPGGGAPPATPGVPGQPPGAGGMPTPGAPPGPSGPLQFSVPSSGVGPLHWGQVVTEEAPHVRIVGPTASGKSTLAQAIAANVAGKLAIIDPVWEPGNWGGLPAVTVGADGSYDPIRKALESLLDELKRRGAELQRGIKEFERLTVIWDEVPDTVAELPDLAGEVIRRMAQRGRHGNMHLIGIGQSDRVESWGIGGYGDAAQNFVTIYIGDKAIEQMPELAGQARPAVLQWRGKTYPIDLSAVPEMAQRKIPAARAYELSQEDRRYQGKSPGEGWVRHEGPHHGVYWTQGGGAGGDSSSSTPAAVPPSRHDPAHELLKAPNEQEAQAVQQEGRQALDLLRKGIGWASEMEHWVAHDLVLHNFSRLPAWVQAPVAFSLKTWFGFYAAGNAMAKRVSQEINGDGADTPEARAAAERTASILAIADGVIFKAGHLPGLHPVGAVGNWLPIASCGYLAVSAARHPIHTINAARKGVREVIGEEFGRVGALVDRLRGRNMSLEGKATNDRDLAKALMQWFQGATEGEADWMQAMYCAALDETHDPHLALDVARRAYEKTKDHPVQMSAGEDNAAFYFQIRDEIRRRFSRG